MALDGSGDGNVRFQAMTQKAASFSNSMTPFAPCKFKVIDDPIDAASHAHTCGLVTSMFCNVCFLSLQICTVISNTPPSHFTMVGA